ncbi:MAG: VWA domain-containing protein [Gammaproteobacteria bacterium]|nr:VWA domain-containing protein [Gammaproteobacteria bacterium]
MKSKITAMALFVFTAGTVALYPPTQSHGTVVTVDPTPIAPVVTQADKIEVVFVLDTTGSMSGLIQAAKDKIWSIANTMVSAQSAPEIKMGLVAYRDRGDTYVTQVLDLSADLDSMYAKLMDFRAAGGGDGPESVNQALYDAVHKMSWSQDQNAYRVVFLVGDAPPHMDYQDDVKYPQTLKEAKQKGIVVNTIQCGRNGRTLQTWKQVAHLGDGRYFQVDQAGGAVALATPFDEKLAELSRKLDGTRLYYGSTEEKAKQSKKVEATDKLHAKSSLGSRARRATFNVSKSGAANLVGEGELVDDVTSGRVDLSGVDRDHLPGPMQDMSVEEQNAVINETAERRNELKGQIQELAQQRSAYLEKEVEELGGAKDSLDVQIYRTVREQAGKLGLRYDAAAPAY